MSAVLQPLAFLLFNQKVVGSRVLLLPIDCWAAYPARWMNLKFKPLSHRLNIGVGDGVQQRRSEAPRSQSRVMCLCCMASDEGLVTLSEPGRTQTVSGALKYRRMAVHTSSLTLHRRRRAGSQTTVYISWLLESTRGAAFSVSAAATTLQSRWGWGEGSTLIVSVGTRKSGCTTGPL